MNENLFKLHEAMDTAFENAQKNGEIIWVKDLSEEEKQEWENRALNDNHVIEGFDGENVIYYWLIPEENN